MKKSKRLERVYIGRPNKKFEAAKLDLQNQLKQLNDELVSKGEPFRYQTRVVYYKATGRVGLYYRLVQSHRRGVLP